jgi:ketosteroid isomerase-like protein
MSQENVEVVKRFEELMIPSLGEDDNAAARAGFNEVMKLLDPDVRFVVADSIPHGGEWVGHEGFLQMCETFQNAWNHIDGGNLEYFDLGGDRVLIVVDPTFQSKETGETITHLMIEIVTVRDGKITELVPYYWDTARLVRACGGVVTPG